jgi:hypothetical protein
MTQFFLPFLSPMGSIAFKLPVNNLSRLRLTYVFST